MGLNLIDYPQRLKELRCAARAELELNGYITGALYGCIDGRGVTAKYGFILSVEIQYSFRTWHGQVHRVPVPREQAYSGKDYEYSVRRMLLGWEALRDCVRAREESWVQIGEGWV